MPSSMGDGWGNLRKIREGPPYSQHCGEGGMVCRWVSFSSMLGRHCARIATPSVRPCRFEGQLSMGNRVEGDNDAARRVATTFEKRKNRI